MSEHETKGQEQGGGAPPDDRILLPSIATLDSILAEQDERDAFFDSDPESESEHFGKTALESRAAVPALVALHRRRRDIVRALAPLAALFEGGQTTSAEARRKQHRALVGTLIAGEMGLDGEKIESKLERLANADERHISFCDDLDALRIKYFRGKTVLLEINEEIRDREESLRVYGKEVAAGLHEPVGA